MKNKKVLLILSALVISTMVACAKRNNTDTSSAVNSTDSVSTTSNDSTLTSQSDKGGETNTSLTVDVPALIRAALEKEYENGTSTNVFTAKNKATGALVSTYTDVEKQIESGKYYIDYASSSYSFQAYVEAGEEAYDLVYIEDGKAVRYTVDVDDWFYYDEELGYGDFEDFSCEYDLPTNYAIVPEDYEMVDGKILCKQEKLAEEGAAIVGEEEAEGVTFTEIELAFDENGYFKKIVLTCEGVDDGVTYVYKNDVTYSDIGTTTYTTPALEAIPYNPAPEVPEHYDPADGVALTADEKTALASAFAAELSNYTVVNYVDFGMVSGYDFFYIDGNKMEEVVKVYLFGEIYSQDSYTYSKEANAEDGFDYYSYEITAAKDVEKVKLEENDTPEYEYPSIYGLSADDFVKVDDTTEDGEAVTTYVLKAEALETMDTSYFVDSDSYLVTVEVTLAEDGNIESVYYIIGEGEGRDASYYEGFTLYKDIGTTEVELMPVGSLLESLTEDDEEILTGIFNGTYDDFEAVQDFVTDSMFQFFEEGNQKWYVQFVEDEEGNEEYDIWILENDKYYHYEEGANGIPVKAEVTKAQFDHVIPTVDFSAIDLADVYYNSYDEAYFIYAEDVDMSKFIPYYDDPEFVASITGITILPAIEEYGLEFAVFVEYINEDGELVTSEGLAFYALQGAE